MTDTDSLRLEIDVDVKGKESLKEFSKTLTELQDKLSAISPMLNNLKNTFSNAGKNLEASAKKVKSATEIISNSTFVSGSNMVDSGESSNSREFPTLPLNDGNIPDTTTLFKLPPLFDKISDSAKKAADGVKLFVSSTASKAVSSVKGFGDKLKGLISSFTRIVKYRMIRSIIKGITSGFTEGIQNLARYSSSFNETMSAFSTSSLYFKNAVATLAQPIVEWLIPKFVELINVCVEVINKINQVAAVMRGASTYNKAKVYNVDYAKSLDKVSKSANKAKESLMAFDEINKLSDNQSASSDGMNYSDMFTTEETPMTDEAVERVQAMVKTIERILGASLMVVGAILCATGHLGLGVGFLIAGAVVTAKSLDWNFTQDKVGNTLAKIEAILGVASLAVGAILAFSGANVPLGIGLMIIGATALAGSIALNWSSVDSRVSDVCDKIALVLSGASLAVGAILAISGANLPLGIALMILGATGLASEVALNWDDLSDRVKGVCTALMVFIGGLALLVGAILAFSGANIPLGIGLMIVGGIALGSAVALNWDTLSTKLSSSMEDLKNTARTKLAELRSQFESWSAKIKTPHISWQSDGLSASGALKKVLETLNLPTTLPKLHVEWYASGGFPDNGELFVARESGAELVGNLGNRTTVANNQQITEGIRQAAYEGFAQALSENGGNGNYTFVAQLNGKTLFEEVIKQNNSATKTLGVSPLGAF